MSKTKQTGYWPFTGRCPVCGSGTIVAATGQGGWTEDRECDRGHVLRVEYNHSNDPGTVTVRKP
jgi:hypothetical protein